MAWIAPAKLPLRDIELAGIVNPRFVFPRFLSPGFVRTRRRLVSAQRHFKRSCICGSERSHVVVTKPSIYLIIHAEVAEVVSELENVLWQKLPLMRITYWWHLVLW